MFLAAVCCADFNVSADVFSPGGSISGGSSVSFSHSLVSIAHTGIREDRGEEGSHGLSLDRAAASSDIVSSMARKLLVYDGEFIPFGSRIHFRRYCLYICISGCAYLIYPVLIRFIHLKDGSK